MSLSDKEESGLSVSRHTNLHLLSPACVWECVSWTDWIAMWVATSTYCSPPSSEEHDLQVQISILDDSCVSNGFYLPMLYLSTVDTFTGEKRNDEMLQVVRLEGSAAPGTTRPVFGTLLRDSVTWWSYDRYMFVSWRAEYTIELVLAQQLLSILESLYELW